MNLFDLKIAKIKSSIYFFDEYAFATHLGMTVSNTVSIISLKIVGDKHLPMTSPMF